MVINAVYWLTFYFIIFYFFLLILRRALPNSIRIDYGLKGINKYIGYNKTKRVMLVINYFIKTNNEIMYAKCGYKYRLFAKSGLVLLMREHTEKVPGYIYLQCIKPCYINIGEIIEHIFWFNMYYTGEVRLYMLYANNRSYFIHTGELLGNLFCFYTMCINLIKLISIIKNR